MFLKDVPNQLEYYLLASQERLQKEKGVPIQGLERMLKVLKATIVILLKIYLHKELIIFFTMFPYILAILAGGQSKRFGTNKALYKIDDHHHLISSFLLHLPKLPACRLPQRIVISLHSPDTLESICLALDSDFSAYMEINPITGQRMLRFLEKPIPLEFIFDSDFGSTPNSQPRAAIFGLSSVFLHVRHGFVLVLPCDLLHMNDTVVNTICNGIDRTEQHYPNLAAVVPRHSSADGKRQFLETLVSFYKVETMLPIVQNHIKEENYRLSSLFSDFKSGEVLYFDIFDHDKAMKKAFQNMNYQKDIILYQKRQSHDINENE